MVNANREQLRHSAQTKKDAANALVSGSQSHPVPAVYLSHVALECALKRRILIQNGVTHIEELKRYLPEGEFEALFSGSTGHDLHHLAGTAKLGRCLEASGNKSLLGNGRWHSMGGQRPYSLRYGVETVTAHNAKDEVQFATKLAVLILQEAP
jgi:ketopantoate reductase